MFMSTASAKESEKQVKIQSGQALSSFVESFVSDLPDNAFELLPEDGAEQHDHYLYGTAKQK